MSSTEATSGTGKIARSLDLLWNTGTRPARGPKPGLSIDRIVTTAVELADAEGLDALSMRRLATELGTGAMSLYRYVPGKAELLDLMIDRVQGESLDAEGATGTDTADGSEAPDWRTAVDAMARGFLNHFRRHPWLLKVNQARILLGPSALRGFELALGPLKSMGFSDPEMISVIVAAQNYATGVARMEIQTAEAVRETGLSDEEFWDSQQPYLERAMASGDFPRQAALSEDAFTADIDHFEFGLHLLLDGLEKRVAERGQSGESPRRA
ncbi:TetR/AcrR family transcriptional regulator [Streptomyces apocyni]|uniref:TetR/AcrR family transcriptional regulator n=1 Tax=Streptomyces apocyni TaxID=2654677 RepID=UPI0012EA602A|nr:TetR/AcrR family transcriptional regulator [Streptomyces apocyni]